MATKRLVNASAAEVDAAADPNSLSGIVTILENLLDSLNPTVGEEAQTFVGLLVSLATFVIGLVNPSTIFTGAERAAVSLGGVGFLVLTVLIRAYLIPKTKSGTATAAMAMHLMYKSDLVKAGISPEPSSALRPRMVPTRDVTDAGQGATPPPPIPSTGI